jgi:radical SAM protein with 4Fe4S-binding SPASM domain
MNISNSNTFCVLPWIHIYANPNGDVLPCCVASKKVGNLHESTIIEIWNSEEYKKLRRMMLNNQRPEHCSDCYLVEDRGIVSKRQNDYRNLNHLVDANIDDSPDFNIKFLDIRWSNICNFKCKTCSGSFSSKWAESEGNKKIFMFAGGEDNEKLYKDLLPYLHQTKRINFGGGEPLLTDKHYEILEYLISINSTDVHLVYNTNLSKLSYKGKSVTKLWNQFKKISVFASIDSWGGRAEYIREGTNWNSIEENIRIVRKESPHIKLEMNVTVSIFNLYTLLDFIDYMYDKKLFEGQPNFYNLINPDHYSANIILDKNSLIENLTSKTYPIHIQQQLDKVINFVKFSVHNPDLIHQFQQKQTDDFISIFPELNFLWKT